MEACGNGKDLQQEPLQPLQNESLWKWQEGSVSQCSWDWGHSGSWVDPQSPTAVIEKWLLCLQVCTASSAHFPHDDRTRNSAPAATVTCTRLWTGPKKPWNIFLWLESPITCLVLILQTQWSLPVALTQLVLLLQSNYARKFAEGGIRLGKEWWEHQPTPS